jgi:hypothetical protein
VSSRIWYSGSIRLRSEAASFSTMRSLGVADAEADSTSSIKALFGICLW